MFKTYVLTIADDVESWEIREFEEKRE
jgi:hypothetical protein